jgi:poly(A) polymerase
MNAPTPPAWLQEKDLQQFFAAVAQAGGAARAVGGCVRDFLLGREGGDIDFATTLAPEKVMDLCATQGWKAIPTGIAHGTVTVVLPSRVVEVTTLRRDVETDGRHARVAFTDDWREDAARRDFTLNALSMDAQGTLYDYFDGQADIAARRLRFIGDPGARIREDGLRILRYFRFLALLAHPPADAEALAAIRAERGMIAGLSGERIANEMRKLLAAPTPAYALRMMTQEAIDIAVFGRAIDPSRMIRLQLLESQADYQASVWARAMTLLRGTGEDAAFLTQRWKLARHETRQLQELVALPSVDAAMPRHAHTRMLRLHGAPVYLDWLLLHAARTPGIDTQPWVALAQSFVPPHFPITAADLLARGMKEGKALGDTLAALEARWEASDYTLSKAALLATLPT